LNFNKKKGKNCIYLRKRAYFKEITILIPNTWKLSYFNNKQILYSTWETIDKADICIEKRDYSIPFVLNYAGECGESGLHVHLTVDYLLNQKRSLHMHGSYKNVIRGIGKSF
jgi:hypothetical protein